MTNALGTLYLIGTPLGNLEDMSFRAVKMLGTVDRLYCEDTRRTQVLLQHFKIVRAKGIKSFHDHSPSHTLKEIKEALESGYSIGYVTDGGMPVVSDPGFVLVREAHRIGAKIEVIPGPTAASTLFSMSALPSPKQLFHAFFPKTKGEIEKVLKLVRDVSVVHIFYESPSRLIATLEIFAKHFTDLEVAVGRELTKMYEETLRGTIQEVLEQLKSKDRIRGECVFAIYCDPSVQVALEGNENNSEKSLENDGKFNKQSELSAAQKQEILEKVKSGGTSKDVAKELSKKFGVTRRLIYEYIIKHLT